MQQFPSFFFFLIYRPDTVIMNTHIMMTAGEVFWFTGIWTYFKAVTTRKLRARQTKLNFSSQPCGNHTLPFCLALFYYCSYHINFKKSPRAPTLSQWSTSGRTSVFNIRPLAPRNDRTHFFMFSFSNCYHLTFTSALGNKEAVMIWSGPLNFNELFQFLLHL